MINPFFDVPDIGVYRAGNTGIDYVQTFKSGVPGPHVCINALTHGNEICGVWAVDSLLRARVRPVCGTLSLSFANVAAFSRFSAETAEQARWVDEDFNRLWDKTTLDGQRHSVELKRARELRDFFSSVDYLLDLHSMHSRGPSLGLCGLTAGGLAFARRMGVSDFIMIDAGHSAGSRLRDYGDFGDECSPRQALLLECGFHFDRASIAIARAAAERILDITGVCPEMNPCPADALPSRVVTITDAITIHSTEFRFVRDWRSMQIVPQAGTLIANDGSTPVLTGYDHCVLVMPAPERYRLQGMTAVRLGRMTN
jgi:succinylglutamate desuccinylase